MSVENYCKLRQIIDHHHNFVIIPHVNPDGDAMGSVLALMRVLKNSGKDAAVVSPNSCPSFLSWLPDVDSVLAFDQDPTTCRARLSEAQVLFFLDFNTPSRLKALSEWVAKSTAVRVMIDHHPDPEESVDILFSDTSVSSTCELLYHVLQGAGMADFLDREAAESLYTGIITDTGALSYNSSKPETYYVVADLLKYGIDKTKVHQYIFNSHSFSRMQLLGYALSAKMKHLEAQEAAYITLSKEELSSYQSKNGDTEGFVNYPLSIDGIAISALILEKDDLIKFSFRSRGEFPVNEFSAAYFNGGGHKNAAGGEFNGTMEEAISAFESCLAQFYQAWIKKN